MDDQCLALVADGERSVEALVDVDACAGVADTIWSWRDLEEMATEGDGVVVVDGALVLEAE
ncbi:MAG: hypothetical protein E3J64_02155, partial [Anaerolineales bacterium]